MRTSRWSQRLLNESKGMGKVWPEILKMNSAEGVINLGQGYPDHEGYEAALKSVSSAVRQPMLNQYSPIGGIPDLTSAVSDLYKWLYGGMPLNASTEVAIVTGATEGLFCAMMGLLNEGDEVIVFAPFFPWYLPLVRLAGGTPVVINLQAPDFKICEEELKKAFTDKTKMVVMNTPHNPTGHVLGREELELLARHCIERDIVCVSDEVYENAIFSTADHIRMTDIPGMADRTLTVAGSSKMLSLTGWRVGWVYGPDDLVAAVRTIHGFTSYCAPAPLQKAVAEALREVVRTEDRTFGGIPELYEGNFKILAEALEKTGAKVCPAQGGYFLVADVSHTGMTDMEYVKWSATEKKVGCVPMGMFFAPDEEGHMASSTLIRFAICKQREYIEAAARNLLA
eukprot:TRINITY_DN2125_c0_g6_i1.p1 TRINITY_DN2125_c0_g6~~TRINITY_DN2125_c0_g6_i1.p1  ORF type:complete len:397 (+),score=135.51 TRINITY_DN2125_c0_g6_i1:43-1233(+)